MAQSKLLIHPSDGGNGVVHHVTPASAGWRYVGFELRKLRQGERCAVDTGDREVCAILISGKARFTADRFDSGIIGERRNVFEGLPWSIYLPPGCFASVEAADGLRGRALLSSRGREARSPCHSARRRRHHDARDGKQRTLRPQRSLRRRHSGREFARGRSHHAGGNWSSYPPHKHDRDALPEESYLEETYYHRLSAAARFRLPAHLHRRSLARRDPYAWATATSCWCRAAITPLARRTVTISIT